MTLKKHKILVPMNDEDASLHAMDMAFLLSLRIPCDITAVYLVPPGKYHSKTDIQKGIWDLILEKIQPELMHAKQWNQFKKSIHFSFVLYEHSQADKIVEIAKKGAFDYLVMWLGGSEKHLMSPLFPDKPTSFKVLGQLSCPLISIKGLLEYHSISNILLPLVNHPHLFKKLNYTIPIAKAFNARMHLLIVMDHQSSEERLNADHVLSLAQEYLQKNGVLSSIEIIHHNKIAETILAYACIVRAELISNGYTDQESYNNIAQEHTSKKIMLCSHIPTFNYYCN